MDMNIREVIKIINQMQADGVIERYAVGGAVGATFYLEPIATLDVDIFVAFKAEAGSVIITPQRIYDYLTARGCAVQGEYIVISGWPVQFLPPSGPLVEEALQTGRAKDKARLLQFIEAGVLDPARFQAILTRHGLGAAWKRFEQQFLRDHP